MFSNRHPASTPPDPHGFAEMSAKYGLYPLSAFVMFGSDQMCGAAEFSTFGLFAFVSALVGFLLIVPVAVIQRYAFGDTWPLAASKGFLAGLLVAIPSPIPGWAIGMWGIAGFIGMKHRAANPETIDTDGEEK